MLRALLTILRRRRMLCGVGATLALAGCADVQVQERIIDPATVGHAIEAATGLSLTQQPAPDRSSMVNLLTTFAGRDRQRAITVLVFDSARATTQPLGRGLTRAPEPAIDVMRERNVLVFYQGDARGRRRLSRALSSLDGVPEDRVATSRFR